MCFKDPSVPEKGSEKQRMAAALFGGLKPVSRSKIIDSKNRRSKTLRKHSHAIFILRIFAALKIELFVGKI